MIAAREIVDLAEVDRDALPLVGGKGANLGALLRAGFVVPPGFCLTTAAYHLFTATAEAFVAAQLSGLDVDDTVALEAASAAIRAHFDTLSIPDDLAASIEQATSSWPLAAGNSTSCRSTRAIPPSPYARAPPPKIYPTPASPASRTRC